MRVEQLDAHAWFAAAPITKIEASAAAALAQRGDSL
jgi:hypothetical protein